MKNRNLKICVIAATALCLMSASAFGAGGLEVETVGWFERIFNMAMDIYPWAAGLAFISACVIAISRGWGPVIVTTLAIFLVGVVKLVVEFASGSTI